MANMYNHMPEEFYRDRSISATAKLVMQRIYSLSKDGEQPVFFNREKYAYDLGCNRDTITNAYQSLVKAGYIEQLTNKNPFDRTLRFKVIKTDSEAQENTDSRKNRQRENRQRNIQQSDNRSFQQLDSRNIQQSDSRKNHTENFSNQKAENFGDLHQIEKSKNIKVEEEEISSTSLTFDSVLSQMFKIHEEEFTPKGIPFTEEDIRSDARTYTMKFKGKPTRDSMYKWMISGDERRSEQRKSQSESNQVSTVQLPKKMTVAEIRAGLARYEEKFCRVGSPFYRGDPDYES